MRFARSCRTRRWCGFRAGTLASSRGAQLRPCGNRRSTSSPRRGADRLLAVARGAGWMGSHFVEWRGHRIHVVDSGHGEPLLLVPGLGNNVDMWKPFMDQFRERRIIRLEAPGTGLSSTPAVPVRIPELSDML